ncbi:radical SAM protein [Candidatus Woesebacteria bacterium]|nr:radical SAM protein [Candidatus Woesebacteria bacterium]
MFSYKKGSILPPKYVIWDCTRRCNLDCKHCGAKNKTYHTELSTKQVKKLIKELVDYKVEYFTVTGGEPLIRKDLIEIFSYAKSNGLKTGLATNGFLVNNKNCKKIAEVFDSVQVSLDGTESIHNNIRGNPLAFQKAVNTIKLLRKYSCKQITVSSVFNPLNLNDFQNLASLVKKLHVDIWKIISVMPIGKISTDKSLYLDRKEFLRLLNLTNKYKKRYRGKPRIEFGENLGYLGKYDSSVRSEPFFCPVGFLSCCIGTNGIVRGCPEQPDIDSFQEGNILENNFSEIWEKGFKKYRELYYLRDSKCRKCKHRKECRGGCWVMRLDKIQCSTSRYSLNS